MPPYLNRILGTETSSTAEESVMHPVMYDLAQAQITSVHRQAQSDALARTARQANGARMRHGEHHMPGLRVMTRRVFAVLGGLSMWTASSHHGTS